jgi:hypothetical protein
MAPPLRRSPWLAGALTVVLVLVLVLVGDFLIRFWYALSVLDADAGGEVLFLGVAIRFSPGSVFMVIALGGGALGGALHAVVSLTAHIAKGDFDAAWTAWYLTNPIVGAALATTFLLVLQGGLTGTGTAAATASAQNLFGIAAAATLSGLFTRHALDKLKDVFDVVFTASKAAPAAAHIDDVAPKPLPVGTATDVTVTGTGFDAAVVVEINGTLLAPTSWTATSLVVALPATAIAKPGEVVVRARDGSGRFGPEFRVGAV